MRHTTGTVLASLLAPSLALTPLYHARYLQQEIPSSDPSSWCTAEFADWKCDCSGLVDGVGSITGCLLNEACNKCNDPSSCIRTEANATVLGTDNYEIDYCYVFNQEWKICLGSQTEGGLSQDTCRFTRGKDEGCCAPDNELCGASFCDPSLEGLKLCDVIESDCPELPIASSPPSPAPSVPFGTVGWPAAFPKCDVNATADCEVVDFSSETGMWYSFVGNGNLLELSPECNDTLANVTMTILSGENCDELVCLTPPQLLDMTCNSIEIRSRRILVPASTFQLQTRLGVTYWFFLDGPPNDVLFESFPFSLLEKGIPPSQTPSNRPSATPSVSASPSASSRPTTFTDRPSTSPSKLPSIPSIGGVSVIPSDVPSEVPSVPEFSEAPTKSGGVDEQKDGTSSETRAVDVEDDGLSTGALVGIILGVLLLLCCCGFGLFTLYRRRQEQARENTPVDEENVDNEKNNLAFHDELGEEGDEVDDEDEDDDNDDDDNNESEDEDDEDDNESDDEDDNDKHSSKE